MDAGNTFDHLPWPCDIIHKDGGEPYDQMRWPCDVLSEGEECCAADDHCSDTTEPFPEAWVACRRCFDEDSLEEDYSDLDADTISSQPRPSTSYEPEDWDAEIFAQEHPYDEEDLVNLPCGKHRSPIGDTLNSDASYLPSLHHAASIRFRETRNSINKNFEAGQFEDADV